MPVAKGLIKRVAAAKNPIADLFTEEQVLFMFSLASNKLDYTKVVVMGPVRASCWKVKHPGLPWPITGEKHPATATNPARFLPRSSSHEFLLSERR